MGSHNHDAALSSWREERQSAWLYRVLADVEPNPTLSALFTTLAGEADSQASLWASRVGAQGGVLPEFAPTLRARFVATLARRSGRCGRFSPA